MVHPTMPKRRHLSVYALATLALVLGSVTAASALSLTSDAADITGQMEESKATRTLHYQPRVHGNSEPPCTMEPLGEQPDGTHYPDNTLLLMVQTTPLSQTTGISAQVPRNKRVELVSALDWIRYYTECQSLLDSTNSSANAGVLASKP